MAATISSSKGVVFEQPDGSKRFVAHIFFDDAAVRESGHPQFDGMERVRIDQPKLQAKGPQRAQHFDSTRGDHPIDVHTYAITLGRDTSLAKLLEFGFAVSADINNGGRTTTLALGKNLPVDDVGRVDDRGIAWMSPVRIAGGFVPVYPDGWTPTLFRDLHDGQAIDIEKGPLTFALDVFAPELTPISAVDPHGVAQKLDIRIEAPFLENARFSYQSNSGVKENDARLVFTHHDPIPAGTYPVRFYKGDELLSTITLKVA